MSSDIRVVSSGGYVVHVDICEDLTMEWVGRAHRLYYAILRELSGIVDEVVLGTTSLAVYYDPRRVRASDLIPLIRRVWSWAREVELGELHRPRRFTIPVLYGGEHGPDLGSVARWAGLSEEEVVRIHSSRVYTCITLGFTPGFIYLGEVDPRIAAPRLETPRVKIPRGSVGIAGKMTGVYGLESPGGWRLIGRTPLTMFDPRRSPPIPIAPGDEVAFRPVSPEEFSRLSGVFVGEYSS